MTKVEITGVTGTMPIDVYVSDYYGNNKTYLGTLNSPIPPPAIFYLPETFDDVPMVKLILTDNSGCELDNNIVCTI